MEVTLLSLICFTNLICYTKITSEKNSHLDEGWPFIGRFKVECVPEMRNKH